MIVSSQGHTLTSFNGSDERINVGQGGALKLDRFQAQSYSFWFVPNNLSTNGLIWSNSITSWSGVDRQITISNIGSTLSFKMQRGTTNAFEKRTISSLVQGELHHCVVVYGGSGSASDVTILVNKVDYTNPSNAQDNLVSNIFTSAMYVAIGARGNSASPINAYIGKFIVYNKALIDSEIETINNFGTNQGLIGIGGEVAQWDMVEVSPLDLIGTNNGTSILMDFTNIIEGVDVFDITNNQGLILSSQYNRYTYYDGSEYTTFGDVYGIQYNEPISIGAWINKYTATNGLIIAKLTSDTNARGYRLQFLSNGKFQLILRNTGTFQLAVETTSIFNINQLYHVVATYDGSGVGSGVTIYVDDVSVGVSITTNNLSSKSILNTEPIAIGAYGVNGTAKNFFDGTIDEAIVSEEELIASDIAYIYSKGISSVDYNGTTKLDSHWSMDTLNPQDKIGSFDGTSYFQDAGNIITEYNDTEDNQGLIITIRDLISFQVVGSPSFDPIVTSTETPTWDLGDGSAKVVSKSFTHVYADTELYRVNMNMVDYTNLTQLRIEADSIYGELDLSALTSCTDFRVSTNSLLTNVFNPISSASIAIYFAVNTGITNLDCSSLTGLGGRFEVNLSANLKYITNPVSSQPFTRYWVHNSGLIGTLNMSTLTGLAGDFRVENNSGLTSVNNPITAGIFSYYRANDCDLGYIDFTKFSGTNDGIIIYLQNNLMTDAEVDHILVDLDNSGWINGLITIHGNNSAPTNGAVTTYDGLSAIDNLTGLLSKGWTVTVTT